MNRKLNILFIHSVCPGQFSALCEHLNQHGLANAYYMATPGNVENNKDRYVNLIPFSPDGEIMKNNSYYYSGKAERASRISMGVYRALIGVIEEKNIDLIVAHGTWGSPHLFYDEVDVPIITYIEFPSYQDHGWHKNYPPHLSQKLSDSNFQMLSYYQVLKSDLTLVPSQYAKTMFPKELQYKIAVQFEGFDLDNIRPRESCDIDLPEGRKLIGFAARDLSSAKGFDHFLAVSKEILRIRKDVHFVIIGDEASTSYGYENNFLESKYGKGHRITFKDYLIEQLELELAYYTFFGKLPYEQYSNLLYRVDVFLYPLRHGSGNWGLLELLLRGLPVIASRECYVDEIIKNGENGVLVEGWEAKEWARIVNDIVSDDKFMSRLSSGAAELKNRFSLEQTSTEYMRYFVAVILNYGNSLTGGNVMLLNNIKYDTVENR